MGAGDFTGLSLRFLFAGGDLRELLPDFCFRSLLSERELERDEGLPPRFREGFLDFRFRSLLFERERERDAGLFPRLSFAEFPSAFWFFGSLL